MKLLSVISLLLVLGTVQSQTVLTVRQGYDNGVDLFSDVQSAIDVAQGGDLIEIYPGSYPGFVVNKPLRIVGTGYGVLENYPELGILTGQVSITGTVAFMGAASGSGLESFSCQTLQIHNTNQLLLRRLRVRKSFDIKDASDLQFEQCFIDANQSVADSKAVLLQGNVLVSFDHCLLVSPATSYSSGGNNYSIGDQHGSHVSATFDHCFFSVQPGFNRGQGQLSFRNSILISGTGGSISATPDYDLSITHNVFRPNASFDGTNLYGVPSASIYQTTGSFDGKYQLIDGSPAIGFATDGSDCGPFGQNGYQLSGLPGTPFIYNYAVPQNATTGGGMTIHVKVKNQN